MPNNERTFAMDLTPRGIMSCVLLDGVDISGLLRGVTVRSCVNEPTSVELHPAKGSRANLTARLPEARIVIADEPTNEQRRLAKDDVKERLITFRQLPALQQSRYVDLLADEIVGVVIALMAR